MASTSQQPQFVDFPTPNRIVAAQRVYASKVKRTPPMNNDDDSPNLFPPHISKDDIFEKSKFRDIDQRASQVPVSVSSDSLENLVQHLIAGTKTDLEKVRSFYVWISTQKDDPKYKIKYDARLDNPYNKVMLAKAMSYDYNKIFYELCQEAKVPCHIVEGAAKGFHNQDDTDFLLDSHHWSIVYVGEAWRFVDQNFACATVRNVLTTESQVVEASVKTITDETPQLASVHINEEHFLTDPELFIYKHFPQNEEMQLLARQITLEEFRHMAIITKAYFDWEFEDLSHPKAHLQTDIGFLEMWFKPKSGNAPFMNYTLIKYTEAKTQKKDDSEGGSHSVDRELAYVRLENKEGRKRFRIYFRKVGLYKFQVLVPEVGDEHHGVSIKWHPLVHYLIRCNCPYFPELGMPVVSPILPELGPDPNWRELHIVSSVLGGIIHTENGFAKLALKHPNHICFNFQLHENDHEDEYEECILIETNDESTTVFIRTPAPGMFILKGFHGDTSEPTVRHSCNFLVDSDMHYPMPLFPQALHKCIGAVGGSTVLRTHSHSYIALGDQEEPLALEMQAASTESRFLTKLFFFNGHQEVHMPEYVWFDHVGDKLDIYCRFKFAGTYIIKIFSKPDENAGSYTLTWKLLIEIDTPTKDCMPYPEKMKDWREDMVLTSPMNKSLKHNIEVPFEIEVPGAPSVGLAKIGEGESFELDTEGEGRFVGNINTLFQEGFIILFIQGESEDDIKQLVRYQVLNESNFNKIISDHAEYVASAKGRKDHLQKAMEAATEEAKEYNEEAKRKEAKRQKHFERNKKNLIAMEEHLEEQAADLHFKANLQRLSLSPVALKDMLDRFTDDEHVHRILQATFLLFETSEHRSEHPDSCKDMLLSMGANTMLEKMLNIKPQKVHPSIMARVRQLILRIDWLNVKAHNPEAGVVFDWVKECAFEYKGDKNAVPADIFMQRQIFNEH